MKIYLASPYSSDDKEVRQERFDNVCWLLGELVKKYPHHVFYSPIVHWHPVALVADLPTGYEFWKKQDEAMLSWADEMWVYCLPDWGASRGIQSEISYMSRLPQKSIEFIGYTMRVEDKP